MKVLLDIKDHKAAFVMELLDSLPFVKAKQLADPKAELIEDIKASVEEVKLAKAGKKKLRTLKDALNDL